MGRSQPSDTEIYTCTDQDCKGTITGNPQLLTQLSTTNLQLQKSEFISALSRSNAQRSILQSYCYKQTPAADSQLSTSQHFDTESELRLHTTYFTNHTCPLIQKSWLRLFQRNQISQSPDAEIRITTNPILNSTLSYSACYFGQLFCKRQQAYLAIRQVKFTARM